MANFKNRTSKMGSKNEHSLGGLNGGEPIPIAIIATEAQEEKGMARAIKLAPEGVHKMSKADLEAGKGDSNPDIFNRKGSNIVNFTKGQQDYIKEHGVAFDYDFGDDRKPVKGYYIETSVQMIEQKDKAGNKHLQPMPHIPKAESELETNKQKAFAKLQSERNKTTPKAELEAKGITPEVAADRLKYTFDFAEKSREAEKRARERLTKEAAAIEQPTAEAEKGLEK